MRQKIFIILFLLLLVVWVTRIDHTPGGGPDKGKNIMEEQYQSRRQQMVREQIIRRGVRDKRVLNAMRKVKRHLFVPSGKRAFSYEDHPLGIGHGQTISQPYIVALMTELLELDGHEKVLEIGTGSGYQAAVLGELAKAVYTIEIKKGLADRAQQIIEDLGYTNVHVRHGDGFKGWPEKAPFDAIIVTCAPEEVPAPLLDQLKEGGRLVIPVGDLFQELKLITKKGGKILTQDMIPVRFVPMLRNESD
jgi:protein-L-isoaspartate(D-aspartate) O-methyltransferase